MARGGLEPRALEYDWSSQLPLPSVTVWQVSIARFLYQSSNIWLHTSVTVLLSQTYSSLVFTCSCSCMARRWSSLSQLHLLLSIAAPQYTLYIAINSNMAKETYVLPININRYHESPPVHSFGSSAHHFSQLFHCGTGWAVGWSRHSHAWTEVEGGFIWT